MSVMATLKSRTLKRKLDHDDEDPYYSSSSSSSHGTSALSEYSDEDSLQCDAMRFWPVKPISPLTHEPRSSILRSTKGTQAKGSVQFGTVTVFLFPRCQGFTSVPSSGGCTLGMVRRHAATRRFTLAEHAVEQHRQRRERVRQRLRAERLEGLKQTLRGSGTLTLEEVNRLTVDDVPEEDLELSSMEVEGRACMQPYPSRERRALLRAAGVTRIDREEKRQLKELRASRAECGCHCQGHCDPETCICNLAGIKCQMDRSNFPCGCSKDCCGNTVGRIEFNSNRVQTHYIHTHMKLALKQRLLDESTEQQLWDAEHYPEERDIPFRLSMSNVTPSLPSVSPSAAFCSEMCADGENSCSSDMTDSSCSSTQSLRSDAAESPVSEQLSGNVEDRGVDHIVSFSDFAECPLSKENGTIHKPQSLNQKFTSGAGSYTTADDICENSAMLSLSNIDNSQFGSNIKTFVECLDENANPTSNLYLNDSFEIPRTPSPSFDRYLDLSLSSDSDLDFFDSFHSPSPIQSFLKMYSHLDNTCALQFPSCPSPPQVDDSGINYLESLIGLC